MPSYIHKLLDADMAFATNMRANDVYMYATNRLDWGHLITAENFDTSHLNNEMYEIMNNRWDWEKRYLHVNYSQNLDMETPPIMVLHTTATAGHSIYAWLLQSCVLNGSNCSRFYNLWSRLRNDMWLAIIIAHFFVYILHVIYYLIIFI